MSYLPYGRIAKFYDILKLDNYTPEYTILQSANLANTRIFTEPKK